MSRSYKDFKIYACFTLNRLVSELGIDIYQPDLESKLDRILDIREHPDTRNILPNDRCQLGGGARVQQCLRHRGC